MVNEPALSPLPPGLREEIAGLLRELPAEAWGHDAAEIDGGDRITVSVEGAPILEVLSADDFPCLDEEDEAENRSCERGAKAIAAFVIAAPRLVRTLLAAVERQQEDLTQLRATKAAIWDNPEKWMRWCDHRVLERAEAAEAQVERLTQEKAKAEESSMTWFRSCEAVEAMNDDLQATLEATEGRLRALEQALEKAIPLLREVRSLDCGAHYCRYCPAKSPAWEHTPSCPYDDSQKKVDAARQLITQLEAALSASEGKG